MEAYYGNGLQLDFWKRVSEASTILISGCGGVYDVVQGLPLYFSLKSQGKEVFLGNMSFSEIKNADGEVILRESNPAMPIVCMRITADTNHGLVDTSNQGFFVEKYLCQWFREELNQEISVYAFKRRGVDKLTAAYQAVIQRHNIQLVILIDGGSDSLMAGDEKDLGTPLEDILSILAVKQARVNAILGCIGIGTDRFQGVSDCSTLRAIAEITEAGGFLGNFSLLQTMPEVQGFIKASEFIQSRMPRENFVGFQIISSILGKFGNYNTLESTHSKKLFINPLMSQYYFFDLQKVARRIKYREFVEDTKNANDFMVGLDYYRNNLEHLIEEEFPRTEEFS
ncbi:unnamed protein product [Blepharisma stoltei]|uniref:Uncharacterized protein n=1 Tax=Blepharisma stoltei TaxID=1481888 RepID=A0AAU9K367_9CILI|nr:unnamed protein product [Blepharisma stoltei]